MQTSTHTLKEEYNSLLKKNLVIYRNTGQKE